MRRLAGFEMSNELLCALLNLPEKTTIRNIGIGRDDIIKIEVESPGIPKRDSVIQANPKWEIIYNQVATFCDWNFIEEDVSDE